MRNSNGFTLVEGLLTLLVVLLLGFGGFYIYTQNDNDADNKEANTTSVEENTNVEESNGEETTTSYSFDGSTVSFTHPASWEVIDYTLHEGTDFSSEATYIKTGEGNYIHLWVPSGVGGDCQSNDDTYTLTQKIRTQTEGVFFTQYNAFDNDHIKVEDQNFLAYSQTEAHRNMEEGDSNTDTCTNRVGWYSAVEGIFITLSDNEEISLTGTITTEDLEADPELETALQTLSVN